MTSGLTKTTERSLPSAAWQVKARIIIEGVSFGALAAEAGLPISTLSNSVSGRNRAARTQVAIWRAFRKLTGQNLTRREFWGGLFREHRKSK